MDGSLGAEGKFGRGGPGHLSVALRGVLLGCAALLLYPPQLPLLGMSGYAVTGAGAALVALFWFVRSRTRAEVAPAGGWTQ
jgi:hypothetical protein